MLNVPENLLLSFGEWCSRVCASRLTAPVLCRVCRPRGSHARKVNEVLPMSVHLGLSRHQQDVTQQKQSVLLDGIK